MIRSSSLLVAAAATLLTLAACGDDDGGGGSENKCSDFESANCVEIAGGDAQALLEAVNTLSDDTTIILGAGTFELNLAVTIRNAGVKLVGQGMDETILDFESTTGGDGVNVIGDGFLVQDLTVANAKKDGIRVEDSDGVVFRRIKATWTRGPHMENGAYGIYPVKCRNVLVEDSVAENAADAGLYVGQCINVIVRRNEVRRNVAGLEIENTQYADVYENLAEDNTCGIVVFDLPGNPVVGRDVRIRDNTIRDNNHVNFAPGGMVAIIPPGTGTFALASRRVEIVNNTYTNNYTAPIAILSGLVVDAAESWALDPAAVIGDIDDLDLPSDGTSVFNYDSEEMIISGNDVQNDSGVLAPDLDQQFGLLMYLLYAAQDGVDHVIYDGYGETVTAPDESTNVNHICVAQDSLAILGLNDVDDPAETTFDDLIRFSAPDLAPFDCTTLTGGPVVVPTEL